MITVQKILNALSRVAAPHTDKDIVSLGAVKNVTVKDNNVSFYLDLQNPESPATQTVTAEAKRQVESLPGIRSVFIQVPEAEGNILNNVKYIIAVSSCKGGVGKSTIAAHIAVELARQKHKVGLVDTDIHGPSIPTLFAAQQNKVKTTDEKKLLPVERYGVKLMSFGFILGDNPAVMRGPIVTRYIQQILFGTKWGDLDYLIIDMPPGTGDVHLTITQSLRLNGAVIVTTPHNLSLIDVARGILMFEKVNVPVLGIIGNMSYFLPPGSDKKYYIFGQSRQEALTKRFGVDILAELPVLPEMAQIDPAVEHRSIQDAVTKIQNNMKTVLSTAKQVPLIYCDDEHITLTWPDGKKEMVRNFDLRLNSLDALSINEMSGESKLKAEDIRKDIKARKVTPLGNYALGIEWNDGHSSGIYPYRLISELAK